MLKFFDRYLLKEIIPPFFIGLLIYSFVLLMNQVFLLSDLFIAHGVSLPAAPLVPSCFPSFRQASIQVDALSL